MELLWRLTEVAYPSCHHAPRGKIKIPLPNEVDDLRIRGKLADNGDDEDTGGS